ncbi:MAG: patatin-like phospholipase family protein [Zetaproteobacteria bacterium]|nr:patatin-like phospholipase family protein [Zetaproteobacteria bacterium]
MKHYLLYTAAATRLNRARAGLLRIGGKVLPSRSSEVLIELQHEMLKDLTLEISLIEHADAVVPHLRSFPVDLLIVDERNGKMPASKSVEMIRTGVDQLAKLWGPDFHFPLNRVITILRDDESAAQTTFELGREHVRDVLVDPHSFLKVVRWIADLIDQDRRSSADKVGIACTGGGIEGFLYQIGCVHALNQALQGRNLFELDVYSGISSGSLVASSLATGISIEELVRSVLGVSDKLTNISSSLIYDLAVKDISTRMLKQSFRWGGLDSAKWADKAMRSIPTGFFKGERLSAFFRECLDTYGAEDCISSLKSTLFIGATDQDSFEHIIFGDQEHKQTCISEAIRASCALPPFFSPAVIQNRHYIDGMITRSSNISRLVKEGCSFIFVIDPMKPIISSEHGESEKLGGIHTLIQTVKTLVQTRFQTELDRVTEKYKNSDFMVFQPYEECAQAMGGSPMKLRIRTNILELAYKETLQRLRERYSVYHVKLAKYGFDLVSTEKLHQLERSGIQT